MCLILQVFFFFLHIGFLTYHEKLAFGPKFLGHIDYQLLGPASGQLSSKSFLGQALVPSLDFFFFLSFFFFFLRFFDVDHF